MATHAHTASRRSPHTAPLTGRRRLGAGLLAVVAGAGVTSGVAAGVATAAADEVPHHAGADRLLFARHADLLAAAVAMGAAEEPGTTDEKVEEASARLNGICWAIIELPPAQTPQGAAVKAAAAMHELRHGYCYGHWRDDGQAMAWNVLSQLAGGAYVPVSRGPSIMASCEPGRA